MVVQPKDPGEIFHLLVTWRCDGMCPGCIFSRQLHNHKDADMSLKTERVVVRKIGPFHEVSIVGGEPTNHPRFWKMVESIAAKKPRTLGITTNGRSFSKSEAAAKKWFSRMAGIAKKAEPAGTAIFVTMSCGDRHAAGLKGGEAEMKQRIKTVKESLPKSGQFHFNFFAELLPNQSRQSVIAKYGLPKETATRLWERNPEGGTSAETLIDPRGRVFRNEKDLLRGEKPIGNIGRHSLKELSRRRLR